MRNRFLLCGVLTLLLAFATGVAPAQQWLARSAPVSELSDSRAAAAQQDPFAGFDEFVIATMKEWKVPGLAIAVIKDGKVVLAKGYGTRDVESGAPVTPQTLFAIGSISKSFTVTALGMLVDEGKLEWDKPLRNYLPDFMLHDPVATERFTPRDLVTHRSGLPRHDLLWYGSDLTRDEMYRRLRYLAPSRDFRSAYQYQNLMFMTAGILVERLSGLTWEQFVRQRIFTPLGMTSSNFSVNDSQKAPDFSYPHGTKKEGERETVVRIPFRNLDQIGPAGSINSSVDQMIRYVEFHIQLGKVGDKQLLSETNAQQMQTPQMVIPGPMQYDEVFHTSYGLGLFITSYRGHKLVHHGGGIDGFISLLSFLPRDKMGAIVLTNFSGNNPVPQIVTYNVYDRLLGLEPVNWVERFREQQQKQEEAQRKAKEEKASQQKQGTQPSHPLTDYAGEYEHPGYGTVKIELDSGKLKLSFNTFSAPLEHFHYDIFQTPELERNPLSEMKITFANNLQGHVETVSVPLESNVDPIVFHRRAGAEMRQRTFLEPFAGEYELGAVIVTVALRGEDTLTLTVPGQPTYVLEPVRGTTFNLKGLKGFSVEFKKDATGKVTEVVFYQPQGTAVAKRKQ
jgi:CubicO group peptidase (beta-lactamase class C family)